MMTFQQLCFFLDDVINNITSLLNAFAGAASHFTMNRDRSLDSFAFFEQMRVALRRNLPRQVSSLPLTELPSRRDRLILLPHLTPVHRFIA